MPEARRHCCGVIGGVLALLLGSPAVQAHPHHWIDVFMEWQFNSEGSIDGVGIGWLFDDYYSVLLVDDAAATDKQLQAILNDILENTSKHAYFVQIEHADGQVEFGSPEQGSISVQDHRIKIDFRLPITRPLVLTDSNVVYQVAEPTYFFEMLHAEEGPAIVLKNAPKTCAYRLEPATPDAALIAYAASLGVNETGGNELGAQFAETVTIGCE